MFGEIRRCSEFVANRAAEIRPVETIKNFTFQALVGGVSFGLGMAERYGMLKLSDSLAGRVSDINVSILNGLDYLAKFAGLKERNPEERNPGTVLGYLCRPNYDTDLEASVRLKTDVLLAPFLEEIMFRGVLQPALSGCIGKKKAIILTSILFALVHLSNGGAYYQSIEGQISLFCTSVVFGIAKEKFGITSSIALHAGYNFLGVALSVGAMNQLNQLYRDRFLGLC